jgi:hypothetical protein
VRHELTCWPVDTLTEEQAKRTELRAAEGLNGRSAIRVAGGGMCALGGGDVIAITSVHVE